MAQQIFEIAFDLDARPGEAGGAHDNGHARRDFQFSGDGFEALAVVGIDNFTRYTAAAHRIGHQDTITASQGKIGRQRGALIAALFLHHLDQHDLAFFDDFLDLVAPRQKRPADMEPALCFIVYVVSAKRLHRFIGASAADFAWRIAIFTRFTGFTGFCGFSVGFRFFSGEIGLFRICRRRRGFVVFRVIDIFIGSVLLFCEQRFPVGNRNLVVVGMDFAKRQKSVTISAILDKRSLQRGFDLHYLREIEISLKLLLRRCFEIKFFESCSVRHDHAGFFRMAGVDQHSFDHLSVFSATAPHRPRTWRGGAVEFGKPIARRYAPSNAAGVPPAMTDSAGPIYAGTCPAAASLVSSISSYVV